MIMGSDGFEYATLADRLLNKPAPTVQNFVVMTFRRVMLERRTEDSAPLSVLAKEAPPYVPDRL